MLVVNTTNELKLKVKWFCHTAKKYRNADFFTFTKKSFRENFIF